MDQKPDRVEPGSLAFTHRAGHLVELQVTIPFQAEVHGVRADRFGGQHGAVQHQVRGPGQQSLVLLTGRLAFHAVGHHHLRPAARSDRPHLDSGGKGGATAPGQPGRRHHGH